MASIVAVGGAVDDSGVPDCKSGMPATVGCGLRGSTGVSGWTGSGLLRVPVPVAIDVLGVCVDADPAVDRVAGSEAVPHPMTHTMSISRQKWSGHPINRFYQIRCTTRKTSK